MNCMHRLNVDICTLSGVQISTSALCTNMMGIKGVVTLRQLHKHLTAAEYWTVWVQTPQLLTAAGPWTVWVHTPQLLPAVGLVCSKLKLHAFRWALAPSYNSIATLMQCFSVPAGFVSAYCKSVTVAMTTLQHDALMRLIIYCFCQWWLKTVIVRQLLWYKYLHIMCLFNALLSRKDATHSSFPCQNKNISRLTK